MSDPVVIPITAAVDDNEKAAVVRAATLLESSLSAAAGDKVTVHCQFDAAGDVAPGGKAPGITIVSLLPEVANYAQPWSDAEARLRKDCQAAVGEDGAPVFLVTVFRHVATGDGFDQKRLVRIRRLNLLAAQLSHELGLFVIDLDRSLADIGASKLQTDYRMNGQYATDAAGKFIALAVLSAGLDDYVSFEAQDAAKITVSEVQLDLAEPVVAKRDMVLQSVLKLGQGRRKQVVATVVDMDNNSHTGWLIHMIMTGQLSVGDALTKLRHSVARRGVRASIGMLVAAVQQVASKSARK